MEKEMKEQIKEYRSKAEQFYNAYQRCLGAVEALQNLQQEKEELENSKK